MNIQTFYRPLALLSIISLVLASTLTTASVSADSSNAGEPAGQLTRRGVTGTVVAVGSSDIVVETTFGNVTINVNGGTIIKSKGEVISLEDINTGDRAGVLLDKAPDVIVEKPGDEPEDPDLTPPEDADGTGTDPDLTPPVDSDGTGTDPDLTPPEDADGTGTDPDLTPPEDADGTGPDPDPVPAPVIAESFRQDVTALRITIVPARATRKHECVVVTETGGGTTTVLDEDGNETELEGDAGVEGEDVCLLTRGKKGGGKQITGSADPSSVDERLARFAERNPEKAAQLEEKLAAQQAKRDARLDRTVNNAPADKRDKAQGAKEKNANRGSRGGGGSGSSGGGGNTGGSGGTGNSGGGNSGNSGGGNSGNSGGGGPPPGKGPNK